MNSWNHVTPHIHDSTIKKREKNLQEEDSIDQCDPESDYKKDEHWYPRQNILSILIYTQQIYFAIAVPNRYIQWC